MPQKQPPANAAVCSPLTFASGASRVGFGMGADLFADTFAMLQELIVVIIDVKIKRLESLRKNVCMSVIRCVESNRSAWSSKVRCLNFKTLLGSGNELRALAA